MARKVLEFEEVGAILKAISAPNRIIDQFRAHAETVAGMRREKEFDNITVASGFGRESRVGFVEFTLDELRTQMDAKKAREVGLMLIEAAEAAASDEIFVKLLERLGIDNSDAHGRILIDLREIRQGTRGTSWPS